MDEERMKANSETKELAGLFLSDDLAITAARTTGTVRGSVAAGVGASEDHLVQADVTHAFPVKLPVETEQADTLVDAWKDTRDSRVFRTGDVDSWSFLAVGDKLCPIIFCIPFMILLKRILCSRFLGGL